MPPVTAEKFTDWPLWWFARLEAAIERGDYETAAESQQVLERLGVTVTYRARASAREEVSGDAN